MVQIDIEMPKSCADCNYTFDSFDGSTACGLNAIRIDWDKRPNDCPLQEVKDCEERVNGQCSFYAS